NGLGVTVVPSLPHPCPAVLDTVLSRGYDAPAQLFRRSLLMSSPALARRLLGLATVLLFAASARAADPRPIVIDVDATDASRKLYRARLDIPAQPGPLTLYYPKWIQGEHQPSGPIIDLAGVQLSAGGKPLPWRRDDVDLHAFHCTVPDG